MSRLFDNYVMVDWSAAAKPATGADSIWIGVHRRDVRLQLRFESHNPSTRKAALDMLVAILADFDKRGDRTLVCETEVEAGCAEVRNRGFSARAAASFRRRRFHRQA